MGGLDVVQYLMYISTKNIYYVHNDYIYLKKNIVLTMKDIFKTVISEFF